MKHTHVLALSAAIAAVISTGASADNHKVEIHADAGRTFFEDSLEDANTWGLGVGFALTENWMLDLVASRWDSETQSGGVDVDGTQYRLDMLYHINTESAWRPYVAFGVGDQEREFNAADPSSERDTLLNLGAGIKRSLGDSWQFRTDVRAFNSLDNEYTDLAVTAGIGFVFGGESAPVAAAPVVAAPVEADSDGDGVLDSKDQCPDTPKTHKVDAVGCSLKLTESVAIELNITFDTAKSIIKPEFESEVANLATFMNQYADTVVTVEGHTDSQGSDAYNQKLSQSRADSVKAALITKYGIGADRVNAIGYGEAKPIADNMNAAGREQNRRVVGQVSTKVTKTETRN
ncbi:OmpA family protein [Cellvibrio fibrivorans]|jgi:OOP family OmpA-OmpF porin|uniref:OOP family OmpA-OmpF porin n=1 Tax=Cellvibrio fibrivorans TaxID=126350 RepID=A0ABU1UUA6_9GAMM|nr:OmpA family protein [Cellvibrio fibrivorans]MDR7088752.1 OOP family OmpA-OmpF porin [Cellvibrio fibrivorans]